MKKGEITAFLSLIFVLLLSFIGAIIESASIQISKSYARGNVDQAIHSVFAEYQKDLLEEYKIFALDSSYEMGNASVENILGRLKYYGAQNGNNSASRIQLLSDEKGAAFREHVIYYMNDKLGGDLLGDILHKVPT